MDGRSVPLRRAAGVFQAVSVPRGPHTVAFAYAPPYIGWGLVAFLAGIAWLAVAPLGVAGRLTRSTA